MTRSETERQRGTEVEEGPDLSSVDMRERPRHGSRRGRSATSPSRADGCSTIESWRRFGPLCMTARVKIVVGVEVFFL